MVGRLTPESGKPSLRLAWRDFEIPPGALASFERLRARERIGLGAETDPAVGFVVRAALFEDGRPVRVRVRTADGAALAARGFLAIAKHRRTEDEARALFERLAGSARMVARDLRGIARWRGLP